MTQPHTAIFVRADDGRMVARLRDIAVRLIDITIFAGSQDHRAKRLAAAVDAELGAISPDAHLPVVLCPAGPPRRGFVGSQALVVPAGDGSRWHVLYPDGRVGSAIDGTDVEQVAVALSAGVELGPVGARPVHPPTSLDGVRAVHVASHPTTIGDERLAETVSVIRAAGATVSVLTVAEGATRWRRAQSGWRLVLSAARERPDVIHIHDAELLPAGAFVAVRRRCVVVYEARDDLRTSIPRRTWLPRPGRRPIGRIVGRIENLLAARVSGILTDTKLAAVNVAARGGDAVAIGDPAEESAKLTALYGRLVKRIT